MEVAMIEMQVKLPDWAGEFIEQQIAAGKYASADELIIDLIDQARVIVADERLSELIREGIECEGADIEYTDDWWEARMDEIKAETTRLAGISE
jgi:Arc/MetJ-type ribon-helix-helix transcriptional regulator